MKKNSIYVFLLIILLISACKPDEKKVVKTDFNHQKIKEQFIKANQQVVIKENDEMDNYQKNHDMVFIKTTCGIRYYVYKPSQNVDYIKEADVITINYTVSLLNGTECYTSKIDGAKTFKVGMENIEDGLQKAMQYLKKGDKALILIPSHLAHGLLGDSKKIPPQVPIVYDVEILSETKNATIN